MERLLDFARAAAEDGRIRALSITDNAGGHPALAPYAIGSEVQRIGLEPLVHFSLKDKNRNQVESHLFLYQRQRFRALLVLGGDFPRAGYHGQAKPVFDLDSIQTLELIQRMEEGRYPDGGSRRRETAPPYPFFTGCVVSPFKISEAEQVWQYARLLRKIRAGADFVVTQLGYDLCKFEELIRLLGDCDLRIPVLANVFIPSPAVARLMARGGVPGVILPGRLVRIIEEEAEAGDRESRLVRAARQIAVLRGLGYSGVHLGGNGLRFDDIRSILDLAAELGDNWEELRPLVHFPLDRTWYLYDRPTACACGSNRLPLAPGRRRGGLFLHELIHGLLFSRSSWSGRLFGRFCLWCGERTLLRTLLTRGERLIKTILFGCRMCGDCTLAESTYLCPQSGCPKKLTNGPCGGSRDRRCEVHPERLCFWVRVYGRLARESTVESLGKAPSLPPKDWSLDQTSSWINYFAGRDHHGR